MNEPAPKPKRHAEFFGVLMVTFLLGWVTSYIGGHRDIDWLYFTGLALVAAPLFVFVAWLGH